MGPLSTDQFSVAFQVPGRPRASKGTKGQRHRQCLDKVGHNSSHSTFGTSSSCSPTVRPLGLRVAGVMTGTWKLSTIEAPEGKAEVGHRIFAFEAMLPLSSNNTPHNRKNLKLTLK